MIGIALTRASAVVSPLKASAAVRRALLLVGGLLAVVVAAWIGDPAPSLRADPELARLLRGMAGIKGAIVVVEMAAVLWRFGLPLSSVAAAAYSVGSWALVFATALIWELTLIPVAAVLFHGAVIGLLFVAWREPGRPRVIARR